MLNVSSCENSLPPHVLGKTRSVRTLLGALDAICSTRRRRSNSRVEHGCEWSYVTWPGKVRCWWCAFLNVCYWRVRVRFSGHGLSCIYHVCVLSSAREQCYSSQRCLPGARSTCSGDVGGIGDIGEIVVGQWWSGECLWVHVRWLYCIITYLFRGWSSSPRAVLSLRIIIKLIF